MIEVTRRELTERLEWHERLTKRDAKADPVIVFLHTPFCGTCAAARKMINIVEHVVPDVRLLEADVNFLPDIVERYQIRAFLHCWLFSRVPSRHRRCCTGWVPCRIS